MGRMKPIGQGETSIRLWDMLFDAQNKSVYTPEKINNILEYFFNLNDLPGAR